MNKSAKLIGMHGDERTEPVTIMVTKLERWILLNMGGARTERGIAKRAYDLAYPGILKAYVEMKQRDRRHDVANNA